MKWNYTVLQTSTDIIKLYAKVEFELTIAVVFSKGMSAQSLVCVLVAGLVTSEAVYSQRS